MIIFSFHKRSIVRESSPRAFSVCLCGGRWEKFESERSENSPFDVTPHRFSLGSAREAAEMNTKNKKLWSNFIYFLFSATIARRLTRKAQLEHVEHNKLQLWRQWNFNYRKVSRLRLSADSVSVVLSSQEAETSLTSFPAPPSFSSSRFCLPLAGLHSRRLITSCNRVIEFGWCRLPAVAFLLIKQLV